MTIQWDPWHTVTVTAVTSCVDEAAALADGDYDLTFEVQHPEPHDNGCPENCMTQQEIDQGCADGLPTGPGVYRIRAWGEYFPGNQVCDPDYDGGIEVERVDVAPARPNETLVHLHFINPVPNGGQSTWIGTSISRSLRIDEATGRRFLDVTIDVDATGLELAAAQEAPAEVAR